MNFKIMFHNVNYTSHLTNYMFTTLATICRLFAKYVLNNIDPCKIEVVSYSTKAVNSNRHLPHFWFFSSLLAFDLCMFFHNTVLLTIWLFCYDLTFPCSKDNSAFETCCAINLFSIRQL